MSDYVVTVCSACRCASCWHGVFMCERSRGASTVDVPASVLATEDREHEFYFSEANLRDVCGQIRYLT